MNRAITTEGRFRGDGNALEAILRVMGEVFYLLDEDGTILDVWIKGNASPHGDSNSAGKSVKDVFPAGIAGQILETVSKVAQTNVPQTLAYIQSRDDRCHWYEGHCSPVKTPDGKPKQFAWLLQDVTERRLAEKKQLARMDKSIQYLVKGITHNFNTFLTVISGNVELALMDKSLVASTQESLEEIKAAAKKAAAMSNQMLAYSSKAQAVAELISPCEHIKNMMPHLRADIPEGIALELKPCEIPGKIQMCKKQLLLLLAILVANAHEAIGDEEGTITIKADTFHADRNYLCEADLGNDLKTGKYFRLEVADTGCGIEPDLRDQIFDPFFSTKFIGRGMNLPVVRSIIRNHNGAIHVESEMNKGTSFKILLPLA
ncbi:MAG: PAS domain-containing protein [Phycisphaerae bacterium]|nr:PAS domain-containing protein [Phycisphaerae bacterium]